MSTSRKRLIARGAIALLIGIIVFCVAYLAAWRQYGPLLSYQGDTRYDLNAIREEIEAHHKRTGALPEALSDLQANEARPFRQNEQKERIDRWRHPFVYLHTADGFEVWSYGRDGLPGGLGLDADRCSDGRGFDESLPTLRQFTEVWGAARTAWPCMVAGLLAMFVFAFNFGIQKVMGARPPTTLETLIVTVLVSVVVVAVLIPLHVPSGH